jgi:hypothetical protein
MSKLSSAFGEKYQAALDQIRTKTFVLGGHEFKVRVPLSSEMDAIQDRIKTVNAEKAEANYVKMTSELRDGVIEGVEVIENDVIVNGKSTRELVNSVLMMENRIVEYIRLLVPINGNLNDITYEEIEQEWPLSVQMEIVEAIGDSIQPGYKDSRKNS